MKPECGTAQSCLLITQVVYTVCDESPREVWTLRLGSDPPPTLPLNGGNSSQMKMSKNNLPLNPNFLALSFEN